MIETFELNLSIGNLLEAVDLLQKEKARLERLATSSEKTLAERLRAAEWALLHFRVADGDQLEPEAYDALIEELQIDDTSIEGLHEQADFAFEEWARLVGRSAQGIETRRAETEGLGAKPESPVAEGDAP